MIGNMSNRWILEIYFKGDANIKYVVFLYIFYWIIIINNNNKDTKYTKKWLFSFSLKIKVGCQRKSRNNMFGQSY